MKKAHRLITMFCLVTCSFAAIVRGADDNEKKKLEDTVGQFYEALSQSKWKAAEQFVEPESREAFRAQPKNSFSKYQLQKIDMQNEGKEAIVTVGVDMPVAVLGGKVLTLGAMTQWKLSKGKWLMVVGTPPYPAGMASGGQAVSEKPTTDLRFDHHDFDFGQKRQGDAINVEFPFVNTTDHPVQVKASLVSICHCIEVKVSKETVAPGESASVIFKLDSTPYTFYFHQGIGVDVEPGDGKATLDVKGFLLPADSNPPLKESSNSNATGQ